MLGTIQLLAVVGNSRNFILIEYMMVCSLIFSEFCIMVRKIFIYTCEEAKKLTPKSKLPINAEENPGKLAADDNVAPSASVDEASVGNRFSQDQPC